MLQGLSGATLSAGRAREPPPPAGQYLVDAVAAYTAFERALAALLHRERTGESQLVQVNMLDAITTLQMQELSVLTVAHKPQLRSAEPHAHVYIRVSYGAFATKGAFIIIAFPPLKRFGEVIGEPPSLTCRTRSIPGAAATKSLRGRASGSQRRPRWNGLRFSAPTTSGQARTTAAPISWRTRRSSTTAPSSNTTIRPRAA
jgi:CoA-transferase family III